MLSIPLHPLVVHFPIALLLVATVVEIFALWKREKLNTTGTILLVVGFIAGIVSYISGDGAEHYAERRFGDAIESKIHTHETYALISMILFGAATVFKLASYFLVKYRKPLYIVVVIAAIIGSIVLGIAGHLGGQMVYEVQ